MLKTLLEKNSEILLITLTNIRPWDYEFQPTFLQNYFYISKNKWTHAYSQWKKTESQGDFEWR